MFSSEVPPEPTPAPTPVSGDFWAGIVDYWVTNWDDVLANLIAIVFIIAIALLIRWVLHFVIERVVKQVVTGVKKKQDVTDTQALQASPSPLAAVRLVQRTRTLGSVLTNIVNVTLFIIVVLFLPGGIVSIPSRLKAAWQKCRPTPSPDEPAITASPTTEPAPASAKS